MSTAAVVNTTMSSTAQRVSPVRGGSGATSFQSVEAIDTEFATRGRDDFARFNDDDDFEMARPRQRYARYADQVVRFSGVFVSREVGTTIVMAQAAYSRANAPTVAPSQAERNVAQYEFNQALMGTPEVPTENGVMH